ncbi:MAG: hypothetical protein EXR75_14860, partial [Myxococcales bacterium]|nr:hypothetical protein [Myxococcales bacterium]
MDILRVYRRRSPKKPIVARSFVAVAARSFLGVVLLLPFANSAAAQIREPASPLTEAAVVRRALLRAPLTDTLEGEVAIEEGRGRAASATPNPQLSYLREQSFGTFGTSEDYLSLAQTIDLGNRRGLHGQAGEARARAAR